MVGGGGYAPLPSGEKTEEEKGVKEKRKERRIEEGRTLQFDNYS